MLLMFGADANFGFTLLSQLRNIAFSCFLFCIFLVVHGGFCLFFSFGGGEGDIWWISIF